MTEPGRQKFPSRLEDDAQLGAPTADPRLDRAQRALHRHGDVRVVETLDIREHDGQALVRREPGEGLLEYGGKLHPLQVLVRCWIVAGDVDRLLLFAPWLVERKRGACAAPPHLVVASVGADSEQPGAERATAVGVNGAEGVDKGVLRGVFGRLRRGKQPQAEVVQRALVPLDQHVEGVEVTRATARGQIRFIVMPVQVRHILAGGRPATPIQDPRNRNSLPYV